MTMYKLIALDLDGTLLNARKEITTHTLETLMLAQEQGLRIALTSGRPARGIQEVAETLKLREYGGFIIANNGGQIVDYASNKVLYKKELDTSFYPLLYQYSIPQDFVILTYTETYVITEDASNEYVQYVSRNNKLPVRQVRSFLEEIRTPRPKVLIVGNSNKLALLEKKMQQDLEGQLNVYRSEPFLLELLPLGIDKATGLRKLISQIGICREEIIACGDGYNDLSMIEFAGMGVAMENAQEVVKKEANYITASNEEDGVALAIERFILKRR